MRIRHIFGVILAVGMMSGCSTTAHLKLPADTELRVTDRKANPDSEGNWKTSPFFWSSTGGAHYQLVNSKGKVLRSGKLKTRFRVVSIFWPPLALIYWPMGLSNEYDLTVPADGYLVRDDETPSGRATPTKKN